MNAVVQDIESDTYELCVWLFNPRWKVNDIHSTTKTFTLLVAIVSCCGKHTL